MCLIKVLQPYSWRSATYARAEYRAALDLFGTSTECLKRGGSVFETHLAKFHVGCCYLALGDIDNAVIEASDDYVSSMRVGDSRAMCAAYLWARATRGNFPYENIGNCLPERHDDIMSTAHGKMAEAHWHTYHGRTAEALDVMRHVSDMIRTSLCVNSHTIYVIPNLAGALRRHALAIRLQDAKASRKLLRRAHKVAKWATRITRFLSQLLSSITPRAGRGFRSTWQTEAGAEMGGDELHGRRQAIGFVRAGSVTTRAGADCLRTWSARSQ